MLQSQRQPPKLLEQVRTTIRTRHYSVRTEEAYLSWIKRFILFHGSAIPATWAYKKCTNSCPIWPWKAR